MRWLLRRGAEGSAARLRTARLELVAITPELLDAEARGVGLAELLKAEVPASWPPEHWEPSVHGFIAKQFDERPETRGWHRYVVLREGRQRTLVGCMGAFPRASNEVEIGYSTASEFQRRGIATEAAGAWIPWLLAREGVSSVTAQTYASLPQSIKVMERCGLRFAGPGDEAGTVRYRRSL